MAEGAVANAAGRETRDYVYKSPLGFAQGVIILFGLVAILDVAGIVADFLYIQAAHARDLSMIEATDQWMIALFLPQVGLRIGLILLFLFWQYAVTRNAIALRGAQQNLSPIMAVAWWFIPIANLFQPCRYMLRVDRLTSPEGHQGSSKRDVNIFFWWISFLVAGYLGQFALRQGMNVRSYSDLVDNSWLSIAATVIELIAIGLIVSIVRGISKDQVAYAARRSGGE